LWISWTPTDLPAASASDKPIAAGAYLALSLLFIVSLFNYLDRWMLSILVPAIKADLDLSDTQIGFITGIAFSLFYATMGIPIARLADRHSRRLVIAAAMGLWSAMTAACGLAQNFAQLAIARVLVGVGEAGATPPSHSLIADLFPRGRRAFALSIYAMGTPFGVFFGFLLGGRLAETYGWRTALFAFGIPGLLLAAVVFMFLKEPDRGAADGIAEPGKSPPLGTTLRTLFSRPTYINNCLASGFYTIVYVALLNWIPSFFSRTHELPISTIGNWLALILGGSQLLGVLGGGWLADRLSAIDMRWLMRLCAIGVVVAIPFYPLALFWPEPTTAFFLLFIPFMISIMQAGPQHATTQGVSPVAMRATAAATYLLIVNLMGGLGPQLVGILSDWFAAAGESRALGTAMVLVAVVFSLLSAVFFYTASRTLITDMNRSTDNAFA
jgi:predicted MFS family arabinose efflux permease